MIPTLTDETAALLSKWREECRLNLLELEKKSIFVRISAFEKIINEKSIQVNKMLCICNERERESALMPYKHYTDSDQQCKFIENWNGLNTNQMRSLPQSLQEYESRAKNWLNGRRAINYAQSLFPEMILCAEHYAESVSKSTFSTHLEKQRLYGDVLLFAYISGICCGRVALYDGHHRASLICENSIKKEGNLKRLLQKYFDGPESDVFSFPKHLQDAIDYFKNKYHEKLNQFQTQYTHRNIINDIKPKQEQYYHQPIRGGSHIGSAQRFRNNPLINTKYSEFNNMEILPPPTPSNHNNLNYYQPPNYIMNEYQQRNSFLEQEVTNYREQKRLDNERIKLLENQIALLRQNTLSPTCSLNHNLSNISIESGVTERGYIGSSTSSPFKSNDDSSTNSYNLPTLPMTNNCNSNAFGIQSVRSYNIQHPPHHHQNHQNQSPTTFTSNSYVPNQPAFGCYGGTTGAFDSNSLDYTQSIITNNNNAF